MSRNLGSMCCYFCDGRVSLTEAPRPITAEDAGVYFPEYEGMIVAHAACVDCETPYLAWIDGTKRKSDGKWRAWPPPAGFDEKGEILPADLSFRSSFNDEPSEKDLPRWMIATKRLRLPLSVATEDANEDTWETIETATNLERIESWQRVFSRKIETPAPKPGASCPGCHDCISWVTDGTACDGTA